MRLLIFALFITLIGCAEDGSKAASAVDLSDCRFLTVESHEFERIGTTNANVYRCTRSIQTCHVYIAVDQSAVSTDCKQY